MSRICRLAKLPDVAVVSIVKVLCTSQTLADAAAAQIEIKPTVPVNVEQ